MLGQVGFAMAGFLVATIAGWVVDWVAAIALVAAVALVAGLVAMVAGLVADLVAVFAMDAMVAMVVVSACCAGTALTH